MYEFGLNQCQNSSANQIHYQLISPIVSRIMKFEKASKNNCVIPKGQNDVLDITIPGSVFPLIGIKRKLKLSLMNTAGMTSANKNYVIHNCTILGSSW